MRLSRLAFLYAGLAAVVLLGATCNLSNKAPAVPTLTGPSEGVAGVAVTFTATTTDPDGDSIALELDWGDGSAFTWSAFLASGAACSTQHTYADSGAFTIKAKAKDKSGKESGWTEGQTLRVAIPGPTFPDSVAGEVTLRRNLYSAVISPNAGLFYIGNYSHASADTAYITPVRMSDRAILSPLSVCSDPRFLVMSADEQYMYVCSQGTSEALKVRVQDGSVDARTAIPGGIYGIALADQERKLFASSPQQNIVYVLDGATLAVTDSIALPGLAYEIVSSAPGTTLYVTYLGGVACIDVPSLSVVRSTQAVPDAWSPTLSQDGQYLYVASTADTGFLALRTSDLSVSGTAKVEDGVRGYMRVSPDGEYLYAATSSGCAVYATSTLAAVGSIDLGEQAKAMVFHPTGDTLYVTGFRKLYVIGKRQ
jgi:hypothetical protein